MTTPTIDLVALLRRLATLALEDVPDTPSARLSAEFFQHNWASVQPLLAKAPRLRLHPRSATPRILDFELDVAFKRQLRPAGPIDLAAGPLCGTIVYAADLFCGAATQPLVTVLIDPALGLLHPNFSRLHGVLCLGHLPPGPFPLDALLEHLYTILTYQNVSAADPADAGAAVWYANDPHPRAGLPPTRPLWGGGAA